MAQRQPVWYHSVITIRPIFAGNPARKSPNHSNPTNYPFSDSYSKRRRESMRDISLEPDRAQIRSEASDYTVSDVVHVEKIRIKIFPKSAMNQLLKHAANDAMLRAAREINSAFVRCQSGDLSAAVSLGYEVHNLRLGDPELACNLARTLYLINAEAAAFVRESVISPQVKPEVLKLKELFNQARLGDLNAYGEIVHLARVLPASNTDELCSKNADSSSNISDLQTLLELAIEDPDALAFLLEASAWINSHISDTAN